MMNIISFNKKHLASVAVLFALTFSTLLSSTTKSHATGAAAGIDFDLFKNVLTSRDSVFIGADAFANHYGSHEIRNNYGVRGIAGYKLFGASVFGVLGQQHSTFSKAREREMNEHSSPIYGFGIGYDLPVTGLGVRLTSTHFNLDRKDGRTERFNNLDLAFVFMI